jgi:hypothetical protein
MKRYCICFVPPTEKGGTGMAGNSKATAAKRMRERAKMEKRKEKLLRNEVRKKDKEDNPRPEGDADPDLDGLTPGPQDPLY